MRDETKIVIVGLLAITALFLAGLYKSHVETMKMMETCAAIHGTMAEVNHASTCVVPGVPR